MYQWTENILLFRLFNIVVHRHMQKRQWENLASLDHCGYCKKQISDLIISKFENRQELELYKKNFNRKKSSAETETFVLYSRINLKYQDDTMILFEM